MSRTNAFELELHVLNRGANEWIPHRRGATLSSVRRIECAAFHNGEFYFCDEGDKLIRVTVAAGNLHWKW
ncbi:F-box protein [Prunus yedoensis var. nudiflora]|uniref:F-box protein n=1 Tax=Prunus yedoensis var. nudiflora TaxID=2094558 RepID=A0A314UC70_PRUYE|nr:F-box protein [Prunus yedoensis var. nudiflora]